MLNWAANRRVPTRRGARAGTSSPAAGFTLVELLITVMVLCIISAMAVPSLMSALKAAKTARAVGDIRTIGMAAYGYYAQTGYAPTTLTDIGYNQQIDPWGHSYQYLPFPSGTVPSNARVDGLNVAINTYFDLYSLGADGKTAADITAADSLDDVLWAYDGDYKGPASNIDLPPNF